MATRQHILPEAQRGLLPELAPLKDLGFVSYGGTAIALRLGHRMSVDFDFLTDRAMDRAAMIAAVPVLADAETLEDGQNVWTVQARPRGPMSHSVQVSFSTASGRVGVPELDDTGSVLLASSDDLLGRELEMLQRRVDLKDYRDIAALLASGLTLERGLGAAKTLFPNLSLSETIKALVYFEARELGEVSEADRAILIGDVSCLTMVADIPLLSHRLVATEAESERRSAI